MKRNKGLGRGLDALLGSDSTPTSASTGVLPLDQLRPAKPATNEDESRILARVGPNRSRRRAVIRRFSCAAVDDGYESLLANGACVRRESPACTRYRSSSSRYLITRLLRWR